MVKPSGTKQARWVGQWDKETTRALRLFQDHQYEESERLFRSALHLVEEFGPNDPALIRSLYNLAGLYHAQGCYDQADPIYRRALSVVETLFGAEHPDRATGLRSLGRLHHARGNYVEAERCYQEALRVGEKAYGQGHAQVNQNLIELAMLYEVQGRRNEALQLYMRIHYRA